MEVAGTWPKGEQDPRLVDLYAAGELIAGKYQLKRVLGAGGMGTVWLATNTILEVDVAIKLLRSDFAGQAEEASQRFLHEARATAKLRHPSIVRLHDFGTTRHGHAFMVMEHLEGESLADSLEKRIKIAPIEAVQLLLQVLDALDLAHEHGIVHRDLKPENVLVVRHGDAFTCKVVDFGIAKVGQQPERAPLDEMTINSAVKRTVSRLTQHGAILGSPQYMSPEQARGAGNVDHRADLWSVTVCLYECIAGRRPFDDEELDQLLISLLTSEPEQPGEAPNALWQIMVKGLAKNRDERWQDASDFGEALALWLMDQGVDVDASGRSLRSRWLGEASIADQSQPLRAVTMSQPDFTLPVVPAAPKAPNNTPLMIASGAAFAAVLGLGGFLLLTSPAPETQLQAAEQPAETAEDAPTAKPAAPPPEPEPEPEPPKVETTASATATATPSATAPLYVKPRDTRPLPKPKKGPKDGLLLPSDADF